MNKIAILLSALFFCAGLIAHPDEPIPPDHSGFSWHTVSLIDFKPGTEDSARKLVEKFESAALSAGMTPPDMHWFKNGKYDLVVTWKLDKSPESDQWSWCPEGESWMNTLTAQEGSLEAARKAQHDYDALVASSVNKVARKAK